jgi:hypothetical protein
LLPETYFGRRRMSSESVLRPFSEYAILGWRWKPNKPKKPITADSRKPAQTANGVIGFIEFVG